MEKTKTSIWASIIDFIRAFANTEVDNNGKINEDKLTAAEKKELAAIRGMDKVEVLEGKTNLRKKYGATVDEAKANKNLNKTEKEIKEIKEKTIDSK